MKTDNTVWHPTMVTAEQRAEQKNQQACLLWYTGLSGSGKSTIANAVDDLLFKRGCHSYLLDGDNVRHGLNGDLGFTDAARVENVRRISEVGKLFVDAGLIVSTAFISPFQSDRDLARQLLPEGRFFEVFIDTPIEVCEQRDPKGLYVKARKGEIKNFTGIDSAYDVPVKPDIHIETAKMDIYECAMQVVNYLSNAGLIAKQ